MRRLLRWTTCLAVLAGAALAQQDPLRVVRTPRNEGDIFDRSLSVVRTLDEDFLREWRALRDRAAADGARTLVLELTASDGDWNVVQRMLDDIADLRASGVTTAVYVPEAAVGPAALIALEADLLVLAPDAEVGAADPAAISGASATGKDSAVLRRETAARAVAAARRNGYPELFVEAMIDPDVEIVRVRRPGAPVAFLRGAEARDLPRGAETHVEVRQGELLRLTLAKAETFGFPVRDAATADDLRDALGLEARPLSRDEVFAMAEKDVGRGRFFGLDWTAILLVAGIAFVILELKTPGLGVSGVVGVVCLSAYFLLNAGGGPGSLFSIGFLLTGFLLLLVEILVLPGFGVAGFLGVALIVFSVYSATIDLPGATLSDQLIPDSEADYARVKEWLVGFLASLLAAGVGALAAAPHLHRLPFFRRAFLEPEASHAPGSERRSEVPTSEGPMPLEPGVRGLAETDLRPSGVARLRERRVDVVADGDYVPRGSRVVVTAVEGMRVVVKREDAT
ncbi:MAG TPA: NfeD family protein [Planctomycetota bacterium]|nr:NfeD family protein [Planctomycetota bacterium]